MFISYSFLGVLLSGISDSGQEGLCAPCGTDFDHILVSSMTVNSISILKKA